MYFFVNHAKGYIQQQNGNKYLIFDDSINENKGLLKKHADAWDGIKNKIKVTNSDEESNYGNDYMKMTFQ